jgi:hypothetical protein
MKAIISVCLAMCLLMGCASVETTRAFNGLRSGDSQIVEHINGNTWGVYLFSTIPLFVPYDEGLVDTDTTVNMVTRQARQLGYSKVTDLQSSLQSDPLDLTFYILWINSCQVSANACK